jgi:Tol biopolymer transport system component
MSTKSDHALIEETGQRAHPRRKGAVALVGIVLAGVVPVTTAGASARTAAAQAVAAGVPGAGARIAFSCGWDVCVMNADGSRRRNVTRSPAIGAINGAPSWSPDGRRIAFASDRNGPFEVYVMNADGLDQQRLTRTKGGGGGSDPTWSPDGQRIAFASNPEGNSDVYVVNADGSDLRRLTRRWDFDGTPVWSPDGRRIAFTSWHRGNDDVYVMNADGTGKRNLTRNAADDHVHAGGWSPDGRRIVFASDRGGNRDIYVMNADGSGQRNLTGNPAADVFAAWSPDGRRIAFTSDRDGNRDIYVMNADGSGQRNLTRNPAGDAEPAWSPLPRRTSSARTAAPVHLYWANSAAKPAAPAIGRARLDGTGVEQSFISGTGRGPCGIALDREHIYWGEAIGGKIGSPDKGGAIGRANRDGSGVDPEFIPTPARHGCGVAIAGSHIFWESWACKIVPGRGCWWAPSSGGAIGRANVDGTGVDDQFITRLAIPRSSAFQTADPCGIAVAGKYIYWMNSAESRRPVPIGRANLDGTGVNKRFITGVTNGFCGIAVVGGHIYWTNGRFLGRANLDGTGVNRRFIRTPGGACGVAVYQGHIYWGQSKDRGFAHPSTTIARANLDGSAVNDQFITGIHDTCGGLAIG